MTTYRVAVRTLCEFAAKQGDLDLRFTPAPTAGEGIAGHQTVASRRSASYQREVALSAAYKHLVVRGRADGFAPESALLEEVKTFKGELDRMPANHRALHWAQAKMYAAMLCRERDLPALTVSLIYFDVDRQEEASPLTAQCTAAELEAFFADLCERFLVWADREMAHRAQRDAGLGQMQFPYGVFRDGQRDLAKSVFQAARLGRCLMAQAPTGIGKTIATVFGLLKASPEQALDKVFFLTAKGTGRLAALDALAALQTTQAGLPLRVLELVAKEKACEHPDKACHGDSCPLAKGFYDRLPAARSVAASTRNLTRSAVRDVAVAHAVCPYYLAQDLARWSDVIVGDYNHYFDLSAMLHGLTLENSWRVGVLVDEAHNLLERARSMYTASLDSADIKAVRALAPEPIHKPLDRLRRSLTRLAKNAPDDYAVLAEMPPTCEAALHDATAAIAEHLAESPAGVDSALLGFYFDGLLFQRLLDALGTHSLLDITRQVPHGGKRQHSAATLCIRNVVPAPFLKERFASAHTTVLFSATLAPSSFYSDTLGLPENAAWLDVASPFRAEQLRVRVSPGVSTRFRHREASLAPIARIIAEQFAAAPGNYIAFFSSFDYLEQAYSAFTARHPGLPVWAQSRHMDDAERAAFLERFQASGQGVGFAVLGGAFGEGIDLVGSRLIGAFIATLGMPQVNPVNEEMRRRMADTFGAGYEYTYLYPGLRKVVQAAGRVIRSTSDTGTVHLMDDRFARPEVLRLLPDWWRIDAAPIASAKNSEATLLGIEKVKP